MNLGFLCIFLLFYAWLELGENCGWVANISGSHGDKEHLRVVINPEPDKRNIRLSSFATQN